MNSFSPPLPRICGGSQRWSPDHHHIRLSAWCRARVKASGSVAKEPTSNGAAQSPNRQQATSATKSARNGHGAMSDLSPLSGEERKSKFGIARSVDDHNSDLPAGPKNS